MRGTGRALVTVSILAVLVAGIGGLFLRALAREIFGVEELLAPPTFQLRAETLFAIGPVAVTNSILSSWLVTFVLIGIMGLAMGPGGRAFPGLRRTGDMLLEFLLSLFRAVSGESWSMLTFSFIATLFLFIVANAWITLLPIYGPVLFHSPDGAVALMRGAGTDINMPLALAIVAGIFVELHAFRTVGIVHFRQFFPFHSLMRRKLATGLGELYLAVLHDITYLARLFSFTFRLFGVLTAGELLRVTISFLTPLILVVPFYGLEILLGLLQAFVFAGLTLVLMVVAEGKKENSQADGR